jgi:hypothetical protein
MWRTNSRTEPKVASVLAESTTRLALFGLPPLSAWLAFEQSARGHMLDGLILQGACGNPAMMSGGPVFFSHCATCWTSGAFAGLSALVLVVVCRNAVSPVLRSAPVPRSDRAG